MPIPIRCASCNAAFRAPDQAAGRKVKCPKCGSVIAVPKVAAVGAAAPVPVDRPVKPVTSEPPPNAESAKRKARLPLYSFEELKVPPRLRRSVEEAVGDEKIVWMGRPTPESLFSKAKIGMWVGLGISIVTIVGMILGISAAEETNPILVIAGVGAVVLLTMGLPLATMPVWVRWLVNYRDCYVLTPTRALVFDNEKILKAEVRSYAPDNLQERHLSVNADGTGSIVFSIEMVDLGDHTTRRTVVREGSRGEKEQVTITKTRKLKGARGFGFVDVEEVEKVEAMLRQVLKLGPPASKDVD